MVEKTNKNGMGNWIAIWLLPQLITIIVTLIVYILGLWDLIKNGKNGIYQCALSYSKPCGIIEYLTQSDVSAIAFGFTILTFLLALVTTNLITGLILLYKKGKKKLVLKIISILIILAILSPLIIKFFQYIW